jgi:hypothetical protein
VTSFGQKPSQASSSAARPPIDYFTAVRRAKI